MTSKALDDWLALDDVADLNNCDREPVHAPSAIQSHGALVVLDTDGNPIQASDNFQQVIERYGGLEALKERLKQPDFARLDPAVPRLATWRVGQETCAVVHSRSDTLTIVELEPADSERSPDVLAVVSEAIDAIENATLEQAFETLCNAIREITGFHRVMAYHMAPDGHGVVVAESTADPEPRFLGLHFPATDIPKQARRLYVLERTRIIADVHAEPIPIRPVINPKTGRPLNMARCQTRTVSPIHIQYLKNMGVGASFSASVVVDDQLEALFACHHPSARNIPPAARLACGLLGRAMAQVVKRERAREAEVCRERVLNAQFMLLAGLGDQPSLNVDSAAWDVASSLMPCEALLVHIDGVTRIIGTLDQEPDRVLAAAQRLCTTQPHFSSEIGQLDPDLSGGMLAVSIVDRGLVAWVRKSLTKTITWGGRQSESPKTSLTPRESFEAFRQEFKGTSAAFAPVDIEVADVVRRALTARFDVTDEPSQNSFERALYQLRVYVRHLEHSHEQQRLANEDLRQFAQAASHDLKAPVRTIRSFIPLIMEEVGPSLSKDGERWMAFITSAADTLDRLQSGVLAFSRVSRETDFEAVNIAEVVSRLIQSHATGLSDATVTIGPLPTVTAVPSQMEMLFSNLIENACKYQSDSRPLNLVIDSQPVVNGHRFSVSDNGIGFPPDKAERMFELFARLHVGHSGGDGLGLALCRRIVHHHDGQIQAISEHQGATFTFTLVRSDGPPQ